jgi:hypothetical protein
MIGFAGDLLFLVVLAQTLDRPYAAEVPCCPGTKPCETASPSQEPTIIWTRYGYSALS